MLGWTLLYSAITTIIIFLLLNHINDIKQEYEAKISEVKSGVKNLNEILKEKQNGKTRR